MILIWGALLFCSLSHGPILEKNQSKKNNYFKDLKPVEKTIHDTIDQKITYNKIPTKLIKINKNSIYY